MWTFSQLGFKDFNAIYVSFHMSKYGTYTFSFFVFVLVRCIFCFSFSWIRIRTGNKTNCFFKNYIWRSIFNYSLLFRIFSESLSCNQLSHETYIDYQQLKRDLGPLQHLRWSSLWIFLTLFFDNCHKELHFRWRQIFSLGIGGS